MTAPTQRHGLQRDLLPLLESGLARRRWLQRVGGMGAAAVLPACAGVSDGDGPVSGTDLTGGTCIAHPAEAAGPFPSDGSNRSGDAISNALAESGVVRTDIRSSFGRSNTIAPGTVLDLEVELVDVNKGCSPLSGYALYIWQCTADGRYSLYDDGVTNDNFLRGVQVSDADGRLRFRTIVPGCYPGRYPHVHYELYKDLDATLNYRNRLLTSQLAVPADICNTVFEGDSNYVQSIANFSTLSVETDFLFDDNKPAEMQAMTLDVEGGMDRGYTGSVTIGLAV